MVVFILSKYYLFSVRRGALLPSLHLDYQFSTGMSSVFGKKILGWDDEAMKTLYIEGFRGIEV